MDKATPETNGQLELKPKEDLSDSYSQGVTEIGLVSDRELSRELGFKEALSIGLGGTIGGGVFSVLGIAAGFAGPAAILSFAFGGVLAILIGYSYSKLALRYQSAGGSYTYAREAFGKYFGGAFGWLLWTGYLASCSLYAYTFGSFFAHMILPEDSVHITWVAGFFAAVLIALSTVINLVGVKETGKSQNIIVLIKVIILVGFVIITIPAAFRNLGNLTPFFADAERNPLDIVTGLAMAVVGTSLLFVAFEGMELIPNASEEIQNPEKNIPRSIYGTVIIATVIYILVAFTALGGTDYTIFAGDPEKAEYALAIAATPILGQAGFIIVSLGALFSTASAFNASLFGSSRMTYVMARDGIFPRVFQTVSKKSRVPFISILTISGVTLVLTLTLDLAQIAQLASSIFLLLFATISLSSLVLRKKIKANFVFPLIGFLLALSLLGVFIWHMINQVMQEDKNARLTLILLPVLIVLMIIGSIVTIKVQERTKKAQS
ncbi:MAG: amino acid permease [Candidatus Heimdallarchaeota archaeon]|nr:amino acid permease [Candidatus Heimdallarchaeota archaeon]MBY8994732.1 amino acid permease [Candidatus Heimdallarchaeota archaeon]